MGLDRLPVLLCWLLGLMGAAYSSSAAWVCWQGSNKSSIESLERAIPLAERLSVPTAGYWLALADLETDKEEQHLRRALQANERSLAALSRLAILEEFRGRREEARALTDQAIRYHRSFKSYMAGLTQASRWGEVGRVEQLAQGALIYSRRDADGVYAQLPDVGMADRILSGQRRTDYFRFLIGQKRYDEALTYETKLERSTPANRHRLELSEVLFWQGRREQSSQLFATLHAEYGTEGVYNARLQMRPSSLGFDWRLSEDPLVRLDWRPGEIAVKLAERQRELEVLSLLIRPKRGKVSRVQPIWTGETAELYWKLEELGDRFQRVALVVPAGGERRFQLKEVHFE